MVVETEHTHERAMLIGLIHSPFMRALKKKLTAYDISVSEAETLPYSFRGVDYVFIALESYTLAEFQQICKTRTRTLVITDNKDVYTNCVNVIKKDRISHVRVVALDIYESHTDAIERVLWFMLSPSSDISLNMSPLLEPAAQKKPVPVEKAPRVLGRRHKIAAIAGMLFLMHTLFFVPLSFAYFFTYIAAKDIKNQKIAESKTAIQAATLSFKLTQGAYVLAQPGLRFLFFSVYTDNLMKVEENALIFTTNTALAIENSRAIASLLLNTHKNDAQVKEVRTRIRNLESQVAALEKSSQNVYDRLTYSPEPIQKIREDFEKISMYLQTGSQFIAHLDTILADNTEKTYMFFFYNNMEIRPGGGFIGSFAKVKFTNYTLTSFDVYDVYDADGQLKTHIRPPAPIREYLNQPHWFLRDSNFKPDFEDNVHTAEYFLEQELQIKDFDGAAAITTTALTYMLEGFGDVYVPDFQETITADNFYLKAQSQTETDFFPGSKQKKSFLSTVARTLMLGLETADHAKLGIAIKRALDEKHIVLYTKDADVQSDIERLGWSGKVLYPQCITNSENCIINHILPVDANLGVNKANYFVNKSMRLKTMFADDGTSTHELNIAYTNNSPPKVFPGGTYKNYFQLYIPHNALVRRVEVNGSHVIFDQSRTGLFSVIGTLVTIQPKETSVVTVVYTLPDKIMTGENAYQIVMQKQIGSFNHEFSLEIVFPQKVLMTHQNFKSVAKNNSVLYNSNLSTNKVFVIEFVKE